MEDYTLQELTKEEGEALTKDLQEVLKKHNAEMGIKSEIQLLKRVQSTPSPIKLDGTDEGKEPQEAD